MNLSRNINMADTGNATAFARTDVLTGMLTMRKFAQVAKWRVVSIFLDLLHSVTVS